MENNADVFKLYSNLPLDFLNPEVILPFPRPGVFLPEYPDITLIIETLPLQLLYSAYMQGSFPWYNEDKGEPVIFYNPHIRFCLQMEKLHIPKSIDRFLKHCPYTFTMDKAFTRVMEECRNVERKGQNGSWIGQQMIHAYTDFHKKGYAHSIEAWQDGELAGGLYGVLIGSVFFGESMFTKKDNSSKAAFAVFARSFLECGGKLIDSQVYTDNIARYGASNISRTAFLHLEKELLYKPLEKDLLTQFNENSKKITNPAARITGPTSANPVK